MVEGNHPNVDRIAPTPYGDFQRYLVAKGAINETRFTPSPSCDFQSCTQVTCPEAIEVGA